MAPRPRKSRISNRLTWCCGVTTRLRSPSRFARRSRGGRRGGIRMRRLALALLHPPRLVARQAPEGVKPKEVVRPVPRRFVLRDPDGGGAVALDPVLNEL